jgi:hypothetical protein
MDPLVRWVLDYSGQYRSQAAQYRAAEQRFGHTPRAVYDRAVGEAARLNRVTRDIQRAPAAARLDTTMGLGGHGGQEVRVPVIYVIEHPRSGLISTMRADVVTQAHYRLYDVRAEVQGAGVRLADESDGNLQQIIYLPGAYYGAGEGYDQPGGY